MVCFDIDACRPADDLIAKMGWDAQSGTLGDKHIRSDDFAARDRYSSMQASAT
ncbi:MAG: hypothetical protein ACI89J_004599, partial [Hyphomicrobiaceae bacterium]